MGVDDAKTGEKTIGSKDAEGHRLERHDKAEDSRVGSGHKLDSHSRTRLAPDAPLADRKGDRAAEELEVASQEYPQSVADDARALAPVSGQPAEAVDAVARHQEQKQSDPGPPEPALRSGRNRVLRTGDPQPQDVGARGTRVHPAAVAKAMDRRSSVFPAARHSVPIHDRIARTPMRTR